MAAHVVSAGRAALVALAALAAAGPAGAAEEASALENMLVRDSELTLHLRSYYFDRHKPGDVINAAWAAGGWLAYRSGWLGELFRFGIVGYTSQPIWAPADTAGSNLLGPEQQSLSVIGQAYVSLKLADQVLTAGRFEVNQPEVNPTDNRMIPNTYEGGNLTGEVSGVRYFAAYLNAMKTVASTRFLNFAEVARASVDISSPMWLVGLDGTPQPESHWRLSSYYVPDILQSNYADGYWTTALSSNYNLRLGAQAMYQTSTGSNALTGASFGTGSGGVKADLIAGPAIFTMAYNQTGRGADYKTPYSGWAGYTYMIVQSFDRAGEKAWLVGGTYDFVDMGLPGLVLNANIVSGRDAIVPSTGAPVPNTTEYDMTVDWRFTAPHWPAWTKPLWVRLRAAYVDQGSAGNTTDYRVIINYPWHLH